MNFMLRFGKQLGCACLMLVAANQASAFSLGGPIGNGSDSYQTDPLAYNLAGDIVAPKNLGEEYRLTTPVLYWAADSTFLDYFGSNGIVALERAFDMYNRLTNVSSYSYDLSEFPLESGRINYTAQSLQLFDLKSATVHILMEHLGLADPDRWTWALRARISLPGTCLYEYHVIMRNFDPVTWTPSRYVNSALYSYIIDEYCPGPPDRADATELLVDPFALPSTAVASEGYPVYTDTGFGLTLISGGLWPGTFYTSFTRDDIGGLRYLYRASNVNFEDAPTDTLQFQTNATPQLIYGSNLTLLASQALTNTAAQLQALYPGLVISSTSNYFVTAWATNLSAYFTNHPWRPIDSFPELVIVTNRTLAVQTLFSHRFENLAVINFGPNGWEANAVTDFSTVTNRTIVTYQTIAVEPAPWLPIDSLQLVTNVSRRSFVENRVVGEFFVLPTNACSLSILAVPLTNVVVSTNFLTSPTTPGVINTNTTGFTNLASLSFEAMVLDYFTNHALVVLPVDCVTNVAELRRGVERIRFVRRDYDSLLGRFFEPVTNDYSMTAVVNNTDVIQRFRRIVTGPDIQINAGEAGGGPRGQLGILWRSINFRTNIIGSTAGPGTIEPVMNLTFNKVGPLNVHIGVGDESSGSLNYIWASFDASTNAPFIFPEGRTIQDLENLIVMQVSPTELALPEGALNEDYALAFPDGFLMAGGQGPYTWTIISGMPPGLTLQPGTNTNTATISGTPTRPGTYDLVIRITDATGRSISREYTLRINR